MNKSHIKLFFTSIICGAIAGFLSVGYKVGLDKLTVLREKLLEYPGAKAVFFITILILAIFIGFLIKWQPLSSGSGIPQVAGEIEGHLSMNPFPVLTAKILGGLSSGFIGMSLGREGPSIQLGALGGKIVSALDKENEKHLISAGAAAGLAAAFNAPISGLIFCIEELNKKINIEIMLSALTAVITADCVSKAITGVGTAFSYSSSYNNIDLPNTIYILVALGCLTAVVGVIFNVLIIKAQILYEKYIPNKIARPVFATIVSFIILLTAPQLLGGGHHLAEFLENHNLLIWQLVLMLILKLLFTVICFSSGTQGGIFLPVLVLGALCGTIFQFFTFEILGKAASAPFIIMGMVGILSAVVRAPLLAIVLVFEMTGKVDSLLPAAIVSLTSYLLAYMLKNPPIYDSLLKRLLNK